MTLVAHDAPIDLTNCALEPIHIPGQCQAHGAVLAVERRTMRIVQVSDNTGELLALEPAALLGTEVCALFEPLDAASLLAAIGPDATARAAVHVCCGSVAGRRPFDVIAHTDGPLAIVEIETAAPRDVVAPDFYDFASRTVAGLHGNPTTRAYCDALASAIRELTGYDRAMIYRFGEDWSGHVVAESMDPSRGLTPYLDLHYPASDIPAQARALFLKNAVRMLPDARYRPARFVPESNPVTSAPLDLSQAFLRGASQMYTEYLTNMGVRASLTMALTDRDQLWGLIACHHYAPRRVSHGVRVVCELLARVASLQLADKVRGDEETYRGRIQAVHARLVEVMAAGHDPTAALARDPDAVRGFVECAGVAVVSAGAVQLEGATPPAAHVRRIASQLAATARDAVVQTERLAALYPDAAGFTDVACGMLAVPLSRTPGEYILWFRPEFARTVTWAGDPSKPVTVGPMGGRLTPRTSFALWAETVRGASQPWTRLEVDAAGRLRSSITELLLRQNHELERLNRELTRSNEDLDEFAYASAHDLKEPLRGIYHYAEFLKRDAAARLEPDDVGKLESVVRLATRMQGLIDSLLEYSRMGRVEVRPAPVALGPLVAGVIDALAPRIRERGAVVRVAPGLPDVQGVPRFYEQIVQNLVTNALKYNDAARVEVDIGAVAAGDAAFPARALGAAHAFYVRDNGIGIAERHRDAVFGIFKRLHARDAYGGGTGAGLTIVKKLVERLGGAVWIEPAAGAGSVFWFTAPGAPRDEASAGGKEPARA